MTSAMTISLSNATNDQLWTILKYDSDIPADLLREVVNEMIYRRLLNNFILQAVKNIFKSISFAERELDADKDELLSMGFEMIAKALNNYESGRSSFATYLNHYLPCLFINAIDERNRDKRVISKHTESYQAKMSDDEDTTFEYYYLMDQRKNTEKQVIDKMMLDEKVSVLTEKEKKAFFLLLKGFTQKEIGTAFNMTQAGASRVLQRAFTKMCGHAINIHKMGLMERTSFKIKTA